MADRQASGGNPFRAILDVGTALVSSLDLDSVFANVARSIGDAMMAWGVEIFTLTDDRTVLERMAFWSTDATPAAETTGRLVIADVPSVQHTLSLAQPGEWHADNAGLSADQRRYFELTGYRTVVFVPLSVGGDLLGALALIERRFVRRFTPIEQDLLGQLCQLASIAIHNAGLYRRLDEQKVHMRSLLDAGRALSSSLVLEDVLTMLAEVATSAFDVESADVYELDTFNDTLVSVATAMPSDPAAGAAYLGTVIRLAENPRARRVLETHDVIEYHVTDRDLSTVAPELFSEMVKWGEQSVLEVGLFIGDEPIGCLSLTVTKHVRRLDDDERELLVSLAASAAVAVRNAQLYRDQELQTRRRSSLLDAGRAITSSIEIDEVLARITREATLALGCSQAAVYDYHAENDTITYKALFEQVPSPAQDDSLESVYALDAFPGDRAILLSREPIVEQLSDPTLPPDRRESMETYDEYTTLNVPLWSQNEPLGILRLYEMEHPRQFTADEIALAVGLGEQAAIAVHTARLVALNRRQHRQIEALLGIGHAVTTVADAGQRLEAATHLAAEMLDASRASVFSYDPATATLVAAAFWSRDPLPHDDGAYELFDALAVDFAARLNSTPAVQRARDESLDAETRDEMGRCGERTRLGVPLTLLGTRLGALVLDWTHEERRLNDEDLALARGLGEHVALALAATL